MKKSTPHAAALMLLASLAVPAWAAGNITQRQDAAHAIELTNLDDAETGQTVVVEGTATTVAPAALPVPLPRAQASKSTLRGKRLVAKDKTGDESDLGTEEAADEGQAQEGAVTGDPQAEANRLAGTDNPGRSQDRSMTVSTPNYAGGTSYANPYSQGSGYATGSGTTGSSSTGGTANSSNTGSNSAGNAAATDTTASTGNSGASSGNGGTGASAAPLTGIQAILSQYRNLMVQEASAANYINSNPALSRRYLAVDRTTYQTRLGR